MMQTHIVEVFKCLSVSWLLSWPRNLMLVIFFSIPKRKNFRENVGMNFNILYRSM